MQKHVVQPKGFHKQWVQRETKSRSEEVPKDDDLVLLQKCRMKLGGGKEQGERKERDGRRCLHMASQHINVAKRRSCPSNLIVANRSSMSAEELSSPFTFILLFSFTSLLFLPFFIYNFHYFRRNSTDLSTLRRRSEGWHFRLHYTR